MDAKAIGKLLKEDHENAIKRLDQIIEGLRGLHDEEKDSREKILKKIRSVLAFFDGEVVGHLNLEEEALFPFLEIHVPKLKPAIRFLVSEHEDFRKDLDIFKFLARDLAKQEDDLDRLAVMDSIKQTGTYLAYLLRHHIEAEQRSIYQVIYKELHLDEMKKLEKTIRSAKQASWASTF